MKLNWMQAAVCPAPIWALRKIPWKYLQTTIIHLVGDDPCLELGLAVYCARSTPELSAVVRTGSTIHLQIHR